MVYHSESYMAIPPGATIKEQLDYRKMAYEQFAERMEMTEVQVRLLLNGQVYITPEIAAKLDAVLGPPVSFWIDYENLYRKRLALVEEENSLLANNN